jgi:hypothetical protein
VTYLLFWAKWLRLKSYIQVVTESSAAPIFDNTDRAGLRADHRNICRFASRNAPGYKLVASTLLRYSRHAPRAVSRRWRTEKDMVRSLRRQELEDLHEEEEQEQVCTKPER